MPLSALRTNILANYAGQAWTALMALAFVPLYLRVLGAEAFGLVGFMLSLQALTQLLDISVGGAANRELARRSQHGDDAQGARDFVRTLEALVWPIAALIGVTLWLASPMIAGRWLHPQELDSAATTRAVAVMALAVAGFWPTSFYNSALSGLERQVPLNIANAAFATFRYGGVVPLLLAKPDVVVFLGWHALVGIVHALVLATMLWRGLPKGDRTARVRWGELRGSRRFAGGLFVIGALALVLSQLDRIALSALRPLAELGYYSLAMSLAAGLGRMVAPVFNALYPRFTRLVAAGEHGQLVSLYHQSTQFLAAVVAAIGTVLIVFGRDVLFLWTGDTAVAERAALPMVILVAGSIFNGLVNLPFALQLAHGSTRLALAANAIALVLAVPLGLAAVESHGMRGAACIWLALNLGYFLFLAPLTHRLMLPGEQRQWYLNDLLGPFAAAGASALLAGWLLPPLPRTALGVLALALASATVLLAASISAPAPRRLLGRALGRGR